MTIQVMCDKCNKVVKIRVYKWNRLEESSGYHGHAIFTLLGKERNYTLCEEHEKEFIKWLEEEGK